MKQVIEGKMFSIKDAPVNTLEERIQRLEDIRAIKECMYHYMRCCDNLDPVGMASCFTQTGKLSWGDVYPNYFDGKNAILAHLKEMMGAAKTQTHYCTNEQIHFETSNSAIVYCCMYSWQTFKNPDVADIYSFGRYESQVVRDMDGEWRFESFKLIMAGTIGGMRASEQFGRPWPPVPIGR